jgi:hypothetical protein
VAAVLRAMGNASCPGRVALSDVRRSAYRGVVDLPVRLAISTCIGCGSLREFATCEGVCRERKLELVSGGDYDELAIVAAACRVRIQGFLPVVEELAGAAPRQADWRVLYESLRGRARVLLKAAGPQAREAIGATSSVQTTVIWRCPDCGGLEATQPCIGICMWRPLDWVEARAFEKERARALRDVELERSLFGLLTRLANVRPRDDEWERNARAFQAQARHILGS